MNKIEFKEPVPTAKLIYGTGLFLFGSINTLSGNFHGLLFFSLGFYFFSKKGIEIDFKNKSYRNFRSLFNLKIGEWKSLPSVEYVSVFRKQQTTRVWVSAASTNITETIIKVNLFYNTNRKITAYETNNIDKAFKKAEEIASLLNVDILDATERESKWL